MPDTQTNYERTKVLTDRLETGMEDPFNERRSVQSEGAMVKYVQVILLSK